MLTGRLLGWVRMASVTAGCRLQFVTSVDVARGTGLCGDGHDGKVMAVGVTREDGNSTVCWFGFLVSGLILVFSLLANLLLKFLLTLSGAPQCLSLIHI